MAESNFETECKDKIHIEDVDFLTLANLDRQLRQSICDSDSLDDSLDSVKTNTSEKVITVSAGSVNEIRGFFSPKFCDHANQSENELV